MDQVYAEGESRLLAVSRLIAVQNTRVFETWVGELAHQVEVPRLAWVSARVAVVREGQAPTVVVLIALKKRAWLALGLLHVIGWWRVRRALGPELKGFRVQVRIV
jgi:hypothetical protein